MTWKYEDAEFYKKLKCEFTKQPSIGHCLFVPFEAPCGSSIQLVRNKDQPGNNPRGDNVTQFLYNGEKIPFELYPSTGGTIKVGSKCRCSLCLYDPSWFYCHCRHCLPNHSFREKPDPRHCPYLYICKSEKIRVYRDWTHIKTGWRHQVMDKDKKCCCIFHNCVENIETPCLCNRCVLDFTCECIVCSKYCNHCGSQQKTSTARDQIECAHKKCDDSKVIVDWLPEFMCDE